MSREPRHLLRFTGCLVVGVSINGALAWILAISVDVFRSPHRGGLAPFREAHWSTSVWQGHGSCVVNSTWRYKQNPGLTQSGPGDSVPKWMRLHEPPAGMPEGAVVEEHRSIDARGWPLLSLWASVRHASTDGNRIRRESGVQGGIEAPMAPWTVVMGRATGRPSVTQPRVLPLRPVWNGFIINSLTLAVTLWLVVFGWGDLRALWRGRRGRCRACGYPIGQSTECSECGAAVQPLPIENR